MTTGRMVMIRSIGYIKKTAAWAPSSTEGVVSVVLRDTVLSKLVKNVWPTPPFLRCELDNVVDENDLRCSMASRESAFFLHSRC